jgi:hypothetical protein
VEGRPPTRLKGTPESSAGKWRDWRMTDLLIAIGVLALLLFPVVARLWAEALPIASASGPALPPLQGHAGGHIRDLPEFVTLPPARVAEIVAGGAPA